MHMVRVDKDALKILRDERKQLTAAMKKLEKENRALKLRVKGGVVPLEISKLFDDRMNDLTTRVSTCDAQIRSCERGEPVSVWRQGGLGL